MQVVAKHPLSRELIARTALELTRDAGLSELSMRKLGGALGVEAMSLYHHVDNKADLLDALLEALFAEIELPRDIPDDDWEQAVRRGLAAFRTVLAGHRGAWELFVTRPATGGRALDVLRWSTERFMLVGLDEKEAALALHAATSFVLGHVAAENGQMRISRSAAGRAELEAGGSATAEFLQTARDLMPDELFQRGLDVVVAGLRAQYRLP